MTEKTEDGSTKAVAQETPVEPQDATAGARRALLKRLGRFAGVTAPTVTLLLAAGTKPAKANQPSGGFSSRQLKTTGEAIDTTAILGSVGGLAVERWRYKVATGLEQHTHIGPYAEDFQKAFGVGDGVTISTIDAIGVCLAAIKALSGKVETLEVELQAAQRRTAA